ncbi:hypothetical protein C8J55DRAFT_551564 [Lentinula edodes]|uniref:Uncharacterized protein n=1 Tax=Lentinula lateritia TaxID=40482 RepID=A0A9W9DGV0_9AGAR|nr:hypothetical protein C8J55DRAFT_551564 [Lentinula edodes]
MIRRPILFASSFRGFRRSFSTSPLVSNYLLSWDQHMEVVRCHADTIDKLNSRLATTNRNWTKDQNLISNLERDVADLKKENAKIQGCFTVMTVLEIITDLYRNRLSNSKGKDVQTILDMILKGRFDKQNLITYADAQSVAIKSVSPSGTFKRKLVNSAASKIYHTLSQHPHSAADDPIVIRENDYTQAEAIAIFSFVHFARTCNLRMLYFNSEGRLVHSV